MGNGEKLAPRSGHGRYTLRCARITALEDHVSLGMLPPAKQVRPHDPREVHKPSVGRKSLDVSAHQGLFRDEPPHR